MRSPDSFRYPDTPLVRKHGPVGYAHHRQYRDWLRDEFRFRCVFCLIREQWGQGKGHFDIDHFEPRKLRPDLATDYDNLVYACHTCNLDKSSKSIPDPAIHAYGRCLEIHDDGTIHPLCSEGLILIDELDLDAKSRTAFRKLILKIINLAVSQGAGDLLEDMLGLPHNLPALRNKPPGGNKRPKGLMESWAVKMARGEVDVVLE